MPDYSKGQIYKIVDVGQTKCYIGSTTQPLSVRMAGHRRGYNSFKNNGVGHYMYIYSMFDEFGIDNCKIIWIENWSCSSRKELEAREGYYQKIIKCINKSIVGKTEDELKQDRSIRDKQRRLGNIEEARKRDKQKDLKRYEKRRGKYTCQCGAEICFDTKYRHKKTNRHQQYLQNQNNSNE